MYNENDGNRFEGDFDRTQHEQQRRYDYYDRYRGDDAEQGSSAGGTRPSGAGMGSGRRGGG